MGGNAASLCHNRGGGLLRFRLHTGLAPLFATSGRHVRREHMRTLRWRQQWSRPQKAAPARAPPAWRAPTWRPSWVGLSPLGVALAIYPRLPPGPKLQPGCGPVSRDWTGDRESPPPMLPNHAVLFEAVGPSQYFAAEPQQTGACAPIGRAAAALCTASLQPRGAAPGEQISCPTYVAVACKRDFPGQQTTPVQGWSRCVSD